MIPRTHLGFSGLAFGLFTATALAEATPRYVLHDLGTFGGPASVAYGINNLGEVAGFAEDFYHRDHAFFYSGGAMHDLGKGIAYSLNDVGQVVGMDPDGEGFVWEAGVVRLLGNLGASPTYPEDINNSGQIVGRSWSTAYIGMRAFLWEDGVMIDLGALGGEESYGTGINEAAQISGYADTAPGPSSEHLHAFRWEDGTMTDLGSLTGWSFGQDINAAGHVVGSSHYPGGGSAWDHAFLWTPEAGMQDLGTLGGRDSCANGINAAGQIVGYATDENEVFRAFLWSDGVMYDLREITNVPPGWQLQIAYDINDAGWIVGSGRGPGGSVRAFLLTPEPASILLLGLLLPFAVRRARLRRV